MKSHLLKIAALSNKILSTEDNISVGIGVNYRLSVATFAYFIALGCEKCYTFSNLCSKTAKMCSILLCYTYNTCNSNAGKHFCHLDIPLLLLSSEDSTTFVDSITIFSR